MEPMAHSRPPSSGFRQSAVRPQHRLSFHQSQGMDISTPSGERQLPADEVFGPARAARNHREVLRLRHGQG